MIRTSLKTNYTKQLKMLKVSFGIVGIYKDRNDEFRCNVINPQVMSVNLFSTHKSLKAGQLLLSCKKTFSYSEMMNHPELSVFFWKEFKTIKEIYEINKNKKDRWSKLIWNY